MIRPTRDLAEVQQHEQALTQTEKLLLRYEEMREWIRNNQRILSGVAVVIVAIVAGLWWWAGQRKENNDRAATYTTRVMNFYLSGDYRHAIDGEMTHKLEGEPLYGLRYIVREYGSSPATTEAALALGNAYYYLGKYDSAKMAFDAAPSTDDPVIQSSIDAGKAAILERGSNKIEAAKLFEKAAGRDKTNPFDAEYLIDAARDYRDAQQKDDAVRVYQRVVSDFPTTQFDDAAKRELLKLGVET
jgi:tetratricopeptide (TPR) repeat protein